MVIPDTSTFGKDLSLRGAKWRLILENSAAAGLVIAVPEIVERELVNRFREELKNEAANIKSHLSRVTSLTGLTLPSPFTDDQRESSIAAYKDRLRSEIELHGGKFLPIPDVPHAELLNRDLNRHRPFSESGKGYRDAMIWETVLAEIRSGSQTVVFITENTRDFSAAGQDGKSALHEHLVSDLETLRAEKRVHFFSKLDDFITNRLFLSLRPAHKRFLDLIKERESRVLSLGTALYPLLDKALTTVYLPDDALGEREIFLQPGVERVDSVSNVTILMEAELPDGKRVLDISADVVALTRTLIKKTQYYAMPIALRPAAEDFNNLCVEARVHAKLQAFGYAFFDVSNCLFTGFELRKVASTFDASF